MVAAAKCEGGGDNNDREGERVNSVIRIMTVMIIIKIK